MDKSTASAIPCLPSAWKQITSQGAATHGQLVPCITCRVTFRSTLVYLMHAPKDGLLLRVLFRPCQTWRALEEAKALGMTDAIGVSNFSPSQLRQLRKTAKVPVDAPPCIVHRLHAERSIW